MGGLDVNTIKDPWRLAQGLRHHYAGRLTEAKDIYVSLCTRHPDHAEARYMLAMVAFQVREYEHAVKLLLTVCRDRPRWELPPYNLGVVYDALGRHGEAEVCYRQSIALRPGMVSALVNLGNSLLGRGEYDQALATWEAAIQGDPETDSEARLNRSFALLLTGRWREGWAEYEHRAKLPGHAAANPMPAGVPLWRGEDLRGKRLLVQEEQGMGDTIMLLRYTGLLRGRGASVLWRVPRSLGGLLTLAGIAWTANEDPVPPAEYVVASFSLPYWLGTEVDSVPAQPRMAA